MKKDSRFGAYITIGMIAIFFLALSLFAFGYIGSLKSQITEPAPEIPSEYYTQRFTVFHRGSLIIPPYSSRAIVISWVPNEDQLTDVNLIRDGWRQALAITWGSSDRLVVSVYEDQNSFAKILVEGREMYGAFIFTDFSAFSNSITVGNPNPVPVTISYHLNGQKSITWHRERSELPNYPLLPDIP